ncbi:MAG: ATP-binding protein [Gemmatimonadota bacterium]|nr:ATP-binding protein [Gemmatimonadales bacterium]MDQ3135979.1 ATP-binding protein [Gemmatimonadota bacterium]
MPSPLRLCVRRSPASRESGAGVLVTLRLPSDVACIEEAVELVTLHCLAGHDAPTRTRFRLQVVLSEALSNAIMRGNREARDKWVHVRAELGPEVIRLEVTDEGPGFDPHAVPEPVGRERLDEADGRGLYLIRKLVDAVQFNEQGNSICMILRRP